VITPEEKALILLDEKEMDILTSNSHGVIPKEISIIEKTKYRLKCIVWSFDRKKKI